MEDIKSIVAELGKVLEARAAKDDALMLIYQALKKISEQEVGFIDKSGDDPTAIRFSDCD